MTPWTKSPGSSAITGPALKTKNPNRRSQAKKIAAEGFESPAGRVWF
jgi:hypothetical protein